MAAKVEVKFDEFLAELKYAVDLLINKKYNLGEYYNHMADFFVFASMPNDADDHRMLAKKWKKEKGESNEA